MDDFDPQTTHQKAGNTHVVVLTLKESQHWYSPYSVYLREWRRARLFARSAKKARAAKRAELLLYDAHENLLVRAPSGLKPLRRSERSDES